jgi:hypothetical protein
MMVAGAGPHLRTHLRTNLSEMSPRHPIGSHPMLLPIVGRDRFQGTRRRSKTSSRVEGTPLDWLVLPEVLQHVVRPALLDLLVRQERS